MNIQDTLSGGLNSLSDGIIGNPLAAVGIAAGTGAIVGAGAGALVATAVSRKKRRKSKSTRKRGSSRRKSRGRRTPRTAGKGKDRSTKRIRYTKNGQPYVLMRSGKARFIKKKSAKRSHRVKGGRY